MEYKITHLPDRNRFETYENGLTAYVEYRPYQGGLDIVHTIVPGPMEGRGVAAALVKATMDYARARSLKITPSCPYVDVYLKRHPEDEDLRDEPDFGVC